MGGDRSLISLIGKVEHRPLMRKIYEERGKDQKGKYDYVVVVGMGESNVKLVPIEGQPLPLTTAVIVRYIHYTFHRHMTHGYVHVALELVADLLNKKLQSGKIVVTSAILYHGKRARTRRIRHVRELKGKELDKIIEIALRLEDLKRGELKKTIEYTERLLKLARIPKAKREKILENPAIKHFLKKQR